jgi:hypothetical protein
MLKYAHDATAGTAARHVLPEIRLFCHKHREWSMAGWHFGHALAGLMDRRAGNEEAICFFECAFCIYRYRPFS